MLKIIILTLSLITSINSYSLVGAGGYVPFGLSTQKEDDGSRRTFSFEPYIFVNTILRAPFNHIFMTEFGYVFHTSKKYDEYKKSTMFLLLDLGYMLRSNLVLRYGIGIFKTSISSDGAAVTLANGTGTSTFYRPSESKTTYNTTWNLGIENSWNKHYATKLEFYLFEPISSKRDISYSLSIAYYL
ncbi:hypothetical protein [Halobacteriovorax sp.]|uniref:hypothetical protein n=1 Tax=Halobacteriovorax sp. TaxID=2020862 RepID=UPI00356773C7